MRACTAYACAAAARSSSSSNARCSRGTAPLLHPRAVRAARVAQLEAPRAGRHGRRGAAPRRRRNGRRALQHARNEEQLHLREAGVQELRRREPRAHPEALARDAEDLLHEPRVVRTVQLRALRACVRECVRVGAVGRGAGRGRTDDRASVATAREWSHSAWCSNGSSAGAAPALSAASSTVSG